MSLLFPLAFEAAEAAAEAKGFRHERLMPGDMLLAMAIGESERRP